MQLASTMARCSLSAVKLPCLSALASEGIVLIVNAIVDTTMNRIDTIAKTCQPVRASPHYWFISLHEKDRLEMTDLNGPKKEQETLADVQ